MSDDAIVLRAASGATVAVEPFGAHVTSWKTADGAERLFLSERAVFDGRTAIRGGIPVIFPQFAGEGPLPKHGFARTARWDVVEVRPTGESPSVTLALADSPATRAVWPFPFRATVTAELRSGALDVSLRVVNAGACDVAFTAALHTYLRVESAFTSALQGLDGVRYRDTTEGGVVKQQGGDLEIRGVVNRIYLDAPAPLSVVHDAGTTDVAMSGFRDVVVWNPGTAGADALPDMHAAEAADMLCVEAAVIGQPVSLAPGEAWRGSQRLAVR